MYSKMVFVFLVALLTLLNVDVLKNRLKNFVRHKFSAGLAAFYTLR